MSPCSAVVRYRFLSGVRRFWFKRGVARMERSEIRDQLGSVTAVPRIALRFIRVTIAGAQFLRGDHDTAILGVRVGDRARRSMRGDDRAGAAAGRVALGF